MSQILDQTINRLNALADADKHKVKEDAYAQTKGMRWVPSPGPQTEAYLSKADILLYGGEPGGGKTSLIIGLALNCHRRSLIMRRQYTDISPIVDETLKFHGSRKGYSGSPPPRLRVSPERFIEFGAAARVGDEQHWMGNPHDLIAFDEGTHFAETQIRFLMGWLRCADDPNQRTRVVIATNPPLSSEGAWVVEMFAPWLDPQHPNPAKHGELRWFVTDEYGKDQEVEGPHLVTLEDGREVKPLSRTYIPASMHDNPYLVGTDYQAQLDALIEPFRSILMGGFMASLRDDVNQCIPTAWIKDAQRRWTPYPRIGIPMCSMGTDVAQGGADETVIAIRYDDWFAPMLTKPGRETPLGSDVAGFILANRKDNAEIILDMGGGYGGATYEKLLDNQIPVVSYKGATAVDTRTKDRQLKFTNKRTEAYWRLREALDPSQDGGATMMLPDDPRLMADLAAPHFEVTPKGLKLETKEDVCARLGRSTDRGDAVVMAWSSGPKFMTDGGEWLVRRETVKNRGTSGVKVITSKDRRNGR